MKNPAHPPKIAPPIISSIIKSYIKNKLLTNYTLYNVRSVECVRKVCSNPILCNTLDQMLYFVIGMGLVVARMGIKFGDSDDF